MKWISYQISTSYNELPYPLEYSPTLEYNLTPFQKSCFWAFSWIEPHFLVKKSPFWGIFWIEPHPKSHIEKYNPVVILERIRYFVLRSPDFSQFILGASMFDFNTSIIAEWTLKYVVFKKKSAYLTGILSNRSTTCEGACVCSRSSTTVSVVRGHPSI